MIFEFSPWGIIYDRKPDGTEVIITKRGINEKNAEGVISHETIEVFLDWEEDIHKLMGGQGYEKELPENAYDGNLDGLPGLFD